MAVKWVKEINILNRSIDAALTGPDKVYLNTNNYSGTVTYYFEGISETGVAALRLYNSNDVQEAVVGPIPAYTRGRSTSFTPDNSYPEKHAVVQSTGYYWKAARIIIVQSDSTAITSTETQVEIGSYEAGLFGGTAEAPKVCTYPKHFLYTAANWDGTKTWEAEVVWVEADDKYYFSCVLQKSSNQTDWTTVHTIVSAAASETATRTRVTLDAADMVDGNYYRIAHWNTGDKDTRGYTIFLAKIICVQYICDQQTTVSGSYPIGISYDAYGMSFTGVSGNLDSVKLLINRTGTCSYNLYAKLYEHSGTFGTSSIPTGSPYATSDAIAASSIPTDPTWVEFTFSSPYTMTNGVHYVIVLEWGYYGGANYISWYYGSGHPGNGCRHNGGWSASAADFCFKAIVEGEITKTESTRLLVNKLVTATGLKDFDQYYDPDNEWDGVTVDSYHEIVGSGAYCAAKLQIDPNGSPTDITDSLVSTVNANYLIRSSAMTMPETAQTIDTNVTWPNVYMSRIVHVIVVAAGGYTLDALPGTHSVSGTTAGLLRSMLLNAVAGTYSVTGSDAVLAKIFVLAADAGNYSLAGQVANLLYSRIFGVDPGAYSVSGSNSNLLFSRIFGVDPGVYSLTGSNAALLRSLLLNAVEGAYSLSGSNAALFRSLLVNAESGIYATSGYDAVLGRIFTLAANPGVFLVTGEVADLLRSYLVGATPGVYSITGSDAALTRSMLLIANSGVYSLVGSDATLEKLVGYTLSAEFGTYLITGAAAQVLYSRIMAANPGVHSVTGSVADFLRSYAVLADPGNYSLSGAAANFLRSLVLQAESGVLNITGSVAGLLRSIILQAEAGNLNLSGQDANLLRGYALQAEAGVINLTGSAVAFLRSLVLQAESGNINLTGQNADLLRSLLLQAGEGSYSTSGSNADLLRSLLLNAGAGNIGVVGQDANLLKDYLLGAGSGIYSLVGSDADLLLIQGYLLQAESGTYVVTGAAADLIYTSTGVEPNYIIIYRRRRRT